MSEEINALEIAVKKASRDSGFMAYVLQKYLEVEKISEKEMLTMLNCSFEDYYKLNLCRVPYVTANDFIVRLNNISQYAHISSIELNKIIKRVYSVLNLSDNKNQINQNSFLIAARDKYNKKDNNKNE